MTKVTIDTDYFLTLVQTQRLGSHDDIPMVPPTSKLDTTIKADVKVKRERTPRAPSEYNLFMKDEIKRLKETSEEKDNKKLFALAASNYTAKKAEAKAKASTESK